MKLRNRNKALIWFQLSLLIATFFVTSSKVQAQWQPGQQYNIEEETYISNVLWETDNATYESRINEYREYHHIVASFNDNSYIVYIDHDWHPIVVKVFTDGNSEEYLLDSEDYQILDNDTHQFFALGVDKDGYIHIFGDMHNFPRYNSEHLPSRFSEAKCMYWRSDKPEDISSFTWMGENFGDCPWGTSFTYPQIFYDQTGGLYFSARVRSETERQYAAVNYNRYNTETKQWELIGGTNELNNQCLFYEDNGENGGTYSKPCRNLHFDLNNRAHFISSLYNHDEPKPLPETNGKYNSALVYAASDDFGKTFIRADGTNISEISMRIDEEQQRPDVIMQGEIINATVSQALTDYSGKVYATGIHYTADGTEMYFCHTFNDSTKIWKDVSSIRPQAKGYFVTDKTGVITFFEKNTSKVHRFFEFEQSRIEKFPFFDIGIDRSYMLQTGNIRGIPRRTNSSEPFQLIEIAVSRPVTYPGSDVEVSVEAVDYMHELKLYPNPALDYVIMEFNKHLKGNVLLYDMFGRRVLEQSIQGNKVRLNLKSVNTGIYIIHIEDGTLLFRPHKLFVE